MGSRPAETSKWATLFLATLFACNRAPAWVAPPPSAPTASREAAIRQMLDQAALARERAALEAWSPGSGAERRRRTLAANTLEAFRSVGEELFHLDAPWGTETHPSEIRPIHPRAGPERPDATRCVGCHHRGGSGGSGTYADIVYLDAVGDDAQTAKRRLPPMLAGIALLERAGSALRNASLGWQHDGPRTVREAVRRCARTHLGVEADDDATDALTVYIALLAVPSRVDPPSAVIPLSIAHGEDLFVRIGCARCHVPGVPMVNGVMFLSAGRTLEVSPMASSGDRRAMHVYAYTDMVEHAMGADLADPGGNDRFATAPLWGLASRGPFLHDGRASTIEAAVVAHDGEARVARATYVSLSSTDRADVRLFLTSLGRPASFEPAR